MNARATKPRVDLDATVERLRRAGLAHAAERLGEAAADEPAPHTVIDRLLDDELNARKERRVRTALRLSAFPTGQTLETFDFSFQPSVERSRIDALATGAWIRAKETLLIQGLPSVGKTRLGVAAVQRGFSVFFCPLEELLAGLRRGGELPPARLSRRKDLSVSLLVIDNVVFEPVDRHEASLFFRLVSYAYDRGSS